MSLVLQDQLFISPKTKEQVFENASNIDQLEAALENEKQERIKADDDIKANIETIEASSDVADLVGTYSDLQSYNTSGLTDQAIICVLADETKEDATTYYRWNANTKSFNFIGEKGPYYTIRQMDNKLQQINSNIADLDSDLIAKTNELNEYISTESTTINTRIDNEVANLTNIIDTNIQELDAKKADLSYVDEQLNTKQSTGDYAEFSQWGTPGRKALAINNNDVFAGKTTKGNAVRLAGMSKYDVAEFGSTTNHTNLSTSTIVYDKAIVTINDTAAIVTDKVLDTVLTDNGNVKKTITTVDIDGKPFNLYDLNVDLSALATKTELKNKTDYVINSTDGKSLIFNEKSGGGAQFVNTVKNTISFVGVNNGNDGVFVQIYSKDKTSNTGARLNVSPSGIYYTNGKTNAKYVATDEIVNKSMLAEAIANIDYSEFATKEELTAGLATKVDEIDVSTFITEDELNAGLDTKQNKLTFDTVPTAGSTNPVTSQGIKTLTDAKQDIISGNPGEILYHNGTSVFSQTLLNEGMVVTTAEDLATCKNTMPSFAEVFNNWTKFSHLNGVDNAVSADLTAWQYDSIKDTITQPRNSDSYCGFVSPKSYTTYDVSVRLYSKDSDDDQIGMVAAFATDATGKQHTLSFIRSPWNNSGEYKWICKVDHCTYEMGATTYNQILLADKTSAITIPTSSASWGSSTIGIGTVIHMTRNGNIITAACSQFNSTKIDENTRITIDLDQLSDTYPVLNNFKGAASWGYSTFSQPYSTYENLGVTNPDAYIFDITSDTVLQYDSKTSSWQTIPDITPLEALGAGRLSYNKITGKLFYCSGKNVFQIATNTNI